MEPHEHGPAPNRIEQDLLDRWLAGAATPEERAQVERWSAERAENAELLAALESSLGPGAEARWDVDAAWERVAAQLQSVSGAPAQANDGPAPAEPALQRRSAAAPARPAPAALPAPKRRNFSAPVRRVSPALLRLAAVLVVALGGVAVWQGVGGPGAFGPATAALIEYTAPVGSTREIRLADGSEVTLAPASRLLVPEDLSGARDVRLEGEALFRVSHDPERPFRVLANGSAARVLGTEFDVRTGQGADAFRVAVASGRVGVGREDAEPAAVLEPGQMAVLDSAGGARVGPADLGRILAWTLGRIELDELTLSDALLELERWYDVDLQVTDPGLAARRVSATFQGEPIEQVLESIALALGARYEREGRVYRVLPSPAPR